MSYDASQPPPAEGSAGADDASSGSLNSNIMHDNENQFLEDHASTTDSLLASLGEDFGPAGASSAEEVQQQEKLNGHHDYDDDSGAVKEPTHRSDSTGGDYLDEQQLEPRPLDPLGEQEQHFQQQSSSRHSVQDISSQQPASDQNGSSMMPSSDHFPSSDTQNTVVNDVDQSSSSQPAPAGSNGQQAQNDFPTNQSSAIDPRSFSNQQPQHPAEASTGAVGGLENAFEGTQQGSLPAAPTLSQQQPPTKKKTYPSPHEEVIELLDDDDDDDENDQTNEQQFKRARTDMMNPSSSSAAAMASNQERQRNIPWNYQQQHQNPASVYPDPSNAYQQQQQQQPHHQPLAGGTGGYAASYQRAPPPSGHHPAPYGYGNNRELASTIQGMYGQQRNFVDPQQATNQAIHDARVQRQRREEEEMKRRYPPCDIGEARDVELVDGFVPSWNEPVREKEPANWVQPGRYKLSLVDSGHFTVTGLSKGDSYYSTSITDTAHLRGPIKRLSRGHTKEGAQKDRETGKWRIPLGAYNAIYRLLTTIPTNYVEPISQMHLKIASMGKARLARGYPSPNKLVLEGVPKGLANALAPFQRGGVDFAIDKQGRALIADEMGLGKTVQSIAVMSIYHGEWPVIVFTPSSARYHWAAEFENWLGEKSPVNNQDFDDDNEGKENPSSDKEADDGSNDPKQEPKEQMKLLSESEIHVVNRSKDDLVPSGVRVVICSYGLAPALAEQGKLYPGQFKCAIVDESHMLKNSKTKRTKALMPILRATSRCILLSGTPALARPIELWPQLHILGTESEDDSWMKNEHEFLNKYGKEANALQNAELHAMLTSSVMIRRLKADILKTMPPKIREKAKVNICTPAMREGFKRLIEMLRGGNGVFGKLATQHSLEKSTDDDHGMPFVDPASSHQQQPQPSSQVEMQHNHDSDGLPKTVAELHAQYNEKLIQMQNYLQASPENENMKLVQQQQFSQHLQAWYQQNMIRLQTSQQLKTPLAPTDLLLQKLQEVASSNPTEGNQRGTVLSMMYNLTAEAKIPLIVDMVRRWVNDPTKGKLCIFAHHLVMLDEIVKQVGLSNDSKSSKKYIRIDGATSPLERQAQIKTFQENPEVRIAVLGLTAAGVAVTLTASSTVWFTELFWTPALMIQAEDRCHRIGQNARVKCLYFVAKGTLDELLWRMIEKKFKDLGEFVEGMEDQKLVVDKEYANVHELHKEMFENSEDSDSDDDDDVDKGKDDDFDEGLVKELQGVIMEKEKEELEELRREKDEDDDEIIVEDESDSKPRSSGPTKNAPPVEGQSQDQPIELELSDDEVDEKVEVLETKKHTPTSAVPDLPEVGEGQNVDMMQLFKGFDYRGQLPGSKVYKIRVSGRGPMGFGFVLVHGRAVCLDTRKGCPRPRRGDILVGINTETLPLEKHMEPIITRIKATKAEQGILDLTFVEGQENFIKYFELFVTERKRRKDEMLRKEELARQQALEEAKKRAADAADQIIEIED